jgi:hypothetical protein
VLWLSRMAVVGLASQGHQRPFGLGQIARVAQAVSIRCRSMFRLHI